MADIFYDEHYGPPPAGSDDEDIGEGYEGKMVAHQAQYLMQNPQLVTNALNQSPVAEYRPFEFDQYGGLFTWDNDRYTIYLSNDNGVYKLTIYGATPDMVETLTPEALQTIKTILSQAPAHGARRRRKTKKHLKKRRTTIR